MVFEGERVLYTKWSLIMSSTFRRSDIRKTDETCDGGSQLTLI